MHLLVRCVCCVQSDGKGGGFQGSRIIFSYFTNLPLIRGGALCIISSPLAEIQEVRGGSLALARAEGVQMHDVCALRKGLSADGGNVILAPAPAGAGRA
jgi:hypothetical protein